METITVGKHHFGGIIDITDPCYDKGVWCRIKANMKDGDYVCLVTRDGYYNQSITIIHEDYKEIPQGAEPEYIGDIGVDAGLAGFFNNKPDYDDDEWSAFCDKLGIDDRSFWLDGNIADGFFCTSGGGDGSYEVYGYSPDDKECVVLQIRFDY